MDVIHLARSAMHADIRATLFAYLTHKLAQRFALLFADSYISCSTLYTNNPHHSQYISYNKFNIGYYRPHDELIIRNDDMLLFIDIFSYSYIKDNIQIRYNRRRDTIATELIIYHCDLYEYIIRIELEYNNIHIYSSIWYHNWHNAPGRIILMDNYYKHKSRTHQQYIALLRDRVGELTRHIRIM